MQPELTIIIPVYNEQDNIPRLHKEVSDYLPRASKPARVLLVNDGSTDHSQGLIEEICQRDERFGFIQFSRNCGLSAALKAGFDHSNTVWVGYLDADLQTSPEDFNVLMQYIDDYALVTGVRRGRKDPFVKRVSSRIANAIRRAFTRDGMDDTGCPLKIIRTECAKRIPMFSGLHRFLPAMILLQKESVIQVPVRHFPRMAGETKFGLGNRLMGPLSDCFAYLWMKRKYIHYTIEKKG